MKSLDVPYFLVALPQLVDENFVQTVVLVGHHDERGAFGLILNNPLFDDNQQPTQMTAELKDVSGKTVIEFHEDLFGGGPVDAEAIFALHNVDALGNEESSIGNDLFLATDPEVFQKLLEKDDFKPRRRFFLGCTSWEGGQLDSELRTGAWMPVLFDRKFVFECIGKEVSNWCENLWKEVLKHGGANPLTLMGQGSGDSGFN